MTTTLQEQTIPTTTETRQRDRRRPRRWWYLGSVGVLGLVLLGAGQPPTTPSLPPAQPAAPRPMNAVVPAAATVAAASPMDEPLRLIHEAQKAYQQVQDYTCLLIKRERINGYLPPDTILDMKVRTQPFSVYLRWVQPREQVGQEVCYVAGRNGGMMRVHPKGVLGSLSGWISLHPDDPKARQTSKRSITEAGIGNMIERFARAWENERRQNLTTQVHVAEYDYNHQRCVRVETIHPNNAHGHFLYYRDVIYFNKVTHLPVRLEFYDWPRQAGDPGQLVEIYSFANMRTNVGLGDDVFNH